MNIENISKIKAEQDLLESRKRILLDKFIPFRTSFLNTLGQFLQDGERIGLRNIRQIKVISEKDGVLQATLKLNGYDLLLVSSDEMYFINLPISVRSPNDLDLYFAVKVCIYITSNEDSKPINEIIVREIPNNLVNYQAYWFTTKEPKMINSGNSVNAEEGIKLADAFIFHYYSFINTWIDRPTKMAMLNKSGVESKPIGFTN